MIVNDRNGFASLLAAGPNGNAANRELLDALPVAVYTTDREGRLTYCNPAAIRLSGRAPDLGADRWTIASRILTADGTVISPEHCSLALLLETGNPPEQKEFLAERPDGTRFWFTPYPAILRNAEGEVTGGVNVLVEIPAPRNAGLEIDEHFRTIVETTPECVKLVAADGKLLFMNTSGLCMIGAANPSAVLGQSVYDVIAPEHRELFRRFNERICSGERGSLEFDIVGMRGERCHMETHAAPLRHIDGSIVHLGITRNVTGRKQAERAGRLLSAVVDSCDDAIISKDLNGVITSWNKSAERLFGYTTEEAVGRSVADLLIPADRQEEEPVILARLRRGERVDHFETKRRRKDNTLLDISLTISPVKDAQGNIVGASKIARDITESKRIRAALLASEASFRQLADAMPQIVWTAGPDGQVDYYNERWYQFTGFDRNVCGDPSWEGILHPEDRERCRETWYSCVESGQPYSIEYRFYDRHEQRWRWFMGRALPVRDFDGNILKWFGSCTDIDEQKMVQENLRRANYDLEQFAFSASHDLQEPLRSVKIYSELLIKRHSSGLNPEAQKFLGFLHGGATRMEMLVRDLLAYTQAVKGEPVDELVDANAVLVSVLSDLDAAICESGAQITSDLLPSLRMHHTHLKQLFQNIIGNAIKYRSPERTPVIQVSVERQNENWLFSVADNGIGIEPQYTENIFGLFKRLHGNDEYSGTGIGLAICRRIVDRYHGRIWVDSEPGKGSVFRFTVPL